MVIAWVFFFFFLPLLIIAIIVGFVRECCVWFADALAELLKILLRFLKRGLVSSNAGDRTKRVVANISVSKLLTNKMHITETEIR